MKLVLRLIISPVVLVGVAVSSIGLGLGSFIVWLFDPNYNHEAAMRANAETLEFLRGFLH